MLVLFRFKNFGPFREEVTLDMRAVKAYKEHQYNLISETSENSFLKVVSIFGANASGKSNFIDAYAMFQKIARHSFQENNKDKKELKPAELTKEEVLKCKTKYFQKLCSSILNY